MKYEVHSKTNEPNIIVSSGGRGVMSRQRKNPLTKRQSSLVGRGPAVDIGILYKY